MARPDEIPPPRPERVVGTKHYVDLGCGNAGRLKEAYYRPLVAFARQNLLWRKHPDRVRRTRSGRPSRRNGVEILVEPRSIVGEITIAIRAGSWSAGTLYCARVIDSSTIVVNEQTSWMK
jgi:hypothetical protein